MKKITTKKTLNNQNFNQEATENLKTIINISKDKESFLLSRDKIFAEVKKLINQGADINTQVEDERTLLHCVVSIGDLEIVEYLLKNGASMNILDDFRNTALFYAKEKNMAKLLLENGADINFQNYFGETPLMYRLCKNNINTELIEFLIDSGTDVNKKCDVMENALICAMKFLDDTEGVKVFKKLIKLTDDLNSKEVNGESALQIAASQRKNNAVKLLIENGANIDIQSKDGWTALMVAARHNNYELGKFLIENKANLNLQECFGKTALMYAVKYSTSIAILLIDKGADLFIEDEDGLTAIDYCRNKYLNKYILYKQKKLSKNANEKQF